jgi:hypothetical protein
LSAQEILAHLPASTQAEVWRRFVDVAGNGCTNPFVVVKLALRPLKRRLDRTAATADLLATLIFMFERHNLTLDLARIAIRHAWKGAPHE